MIVIGRKSKAINYEVKLEPIYIDAMEANQFYMNDYVNETGKQIKFKLGKDNFVDFNKVSTRKAVINDSLFLRYMESSITRNVGDICNDFVVLKFNYDVDFIVEGEEIKRDVHELRNKYYEEGITIIYDKKNKESGEIEPHPIYYKMLMRSTGKAKKGECVFIRDSLYHKAINFLTMGLYDLMDEQSKKDPEKVFRLVELSAYQTLTTATSVGYIQIPLENILILKDEEVYSDEMKAAIVSTEDVEHEIVERVPDFDNSRFEELINKKGFTFDEGKAKNNTALTFVEKSKRALKENGIRPNGKYPYVTKTEIKMRKQCKVDMVSDAKIKNVLWDGMGLCDESIFPKNMDGFIYCRSHFFKSCLFRGNLQEFFKDYCNEHNIDYESHTVEDVDMFGRKLRLSDIKVIITDKSIKWIGKFIDMMGGTDEKAYEYYRKYMKGHDDYFSVVKTAHPGKWDDLQLSTYQMNNSLPTTDRKVLGGVGKEGIDFLNRLKASDEEYLKYLDKTKDDMNINELIIELVRWNPDFVKTEFFRTTKKSKDISSLKKEFEKGRLPQSGDNLTIMDNPIALLLKAVGNKSFLNEECFELVEDGVQCYTPRFNDGDRLAAFRSPHNSPNNILHFYNVYPERLIRYFPNIGQNVIVFNAIKTDTQARASGHDCDSDFVYVTNQKDLADLARKAYTEYPTIINEVEEVGSSEYHFTPSDYAKMDNQIADAQESIGTSTDTAQLALSYYYDEDMQSKELEECFIILSVIGQISIDLAKKTFDIKVVDEIRRIRSLPCMRRSEIPSFFAKNKKDRNNKDFGNKVKDMNCPMDILAEIIEDGVMDYSDRIYHEPLRKFWNRTIKGKGNRYKEEKVINASREYNKSRKWLEKHKNQLNDSTFFALENRAMKQFLNKTTSTKKKYLDQETVMQLVIYATDDDNSDVCTTILNFLFRNYREEFMNCFVGNEQKTNDIFDKSA